MEIESYLKALFKISDSTYVSFLSLHEFSVSQLSIPVKEKIKAIQLHKYQ